jgi:hypothetical protein
VNVKNTLMQYLVQRDHLADLSKFWEISCFSSEGAMAQNTNSHEIYQFVVCLK